MKTFAILVVGFAAATISGAAYADPDKDESGKGRWRGNYHRYDRNGYEEVVKFRTADGCEVERKWKKGEYEEKIKCKPGSYGYRN